MGGGASKHSKLPAKSEASEKKKENQTKKNLKNSDNKESDKMENPVASPKEHITVCFRPSMKKVDFETPTTFAEVVKHPFALEDEKNHEVKLESENKEIQIRADNPIVAVMVNNMMLSLNDRVDGCFGEELELEPIFLKTAEGHPVYRRSLTFIFRMACHWLFNRHLWEEEKWNLVKKAIENTEAGKKLSNDILDEKNLLPLLGKPKDTSTLITVEHQLGNGYLGEFSNVSATPQVCELVRNVMHAISQANLTISKKKRIHKEVKRYFKKQAQTFSLSLVKSINSPFLYVDFCLGFQQLNHRPLVHNTSMCADFDVEPIATKIGKDGQPTKFAANIMFPPDPFKLVYHYNQTELIQVYQEYNDMCKNFKVACAGDLNKLVREEKIREFIVKDEAYHNGKIRSIAQTVFQRISDPAVPDDKKLKLILIAGPSASGKTTFAKKLGLLLEIYSLNPVIISLDDYYKPNSECPLNEKGEYDFEALEALRIDKLNEDLKALLSGQEVETPLFDFTCGKPKTKGKMLKLNENDILVMEGIHGLNPALTPLVPDERKFKIFLAPLSQINLDEGNYISNEISRLIRRIVRDFKHRNASVEKTLKMWDEVRKGEHKYIFPFLKNADYIMNTSLDFEIPVLKVYARPLLISVKPSSKFYDQARNLLRFMENFNSIAATYVPQDSLLREFIGGSIFE